MHKLYIEKGEVTERKAEVPGINAPKPHTTPDLVNVDSFKTASESLVTPQATCSQPHLMRLSTQSSYRPVASRYWPNS